MMKVACPEEIWDKVISGRDKEIKIGIFTFVFGIALYFPMITKWLCNPDAVWQGIVYKSGYGWENTLGRIGLEKFNKLKGFFIYPSAQTIWCLLLTALIAVLLYKLFEVKNALYGGLIGVLLVCSPSLCSTLTYYYTADAYMTAYLFAVLFVVLLAKGRGIASLLSAVFLLACSVALYQAYVGSAIALCLLYLLFLLVEKREGWRKALWTGGRFLIGGVSGVAFYLLLYRVYCIVNHIVPEANRGFDSMGKIPLGRLPELVGQAYRYFFDYFFTDALYNNSWHYRGKCNVAVAILFIVVMAVLAVRKKQYKRAAETVMAAFGLLLIPLAFMSIVIMAPEVSITEVTGILMLPHMNFIYIFLIVLAEGNAEKPRYFWPVKWLTVLLCGFMGLTLGMYTQVFQNCMELELNRSCALGQRMVAEIEDLPEYEAGMKLVIGGTAERGNFPRSYPELYYVVKGTAVEYGFFWDSFNGRQGCWNEFLRQYIGVEYRVCGQEELQSIFASEEYAGMPVFPEEGSVRMIGDCAVVKLSEG